MRKLQSVMSNGLAFLLLCVLSARAIHQSNVQAMHRNTDRPECIETLELKALTRMHTYLRKTTWEDVKWKFAYGILMDSGISCDLYPFGEDILGTLGLHPDVWRPAAGRSRNHSAMKQVTLPQELFSPYWQGWCARIGFPQALCCNREVDSVASDCFDAMHTMERCCAGNRKPKARLYQIAGVVKVWVQGRCSSSPPRKVWRTTSKDNDRLVACERWEGKFPHAMPTIPRRGTVVDSEVVSYELCEEGSLISHGLQAVVVSFGHYSGCFSSSLTSLPVQAWQPQAWPMATHGVGAVGAICLPLLPTSITIEEQNVVQADFGEIAIASIGVLARSLFYSATGDLDTFSNDEENVKLASGAQEEQAATMQSGLDKAAYDSRCLLTPTHPPHFPHVALMTEAVGRLARDPFQHRPPHVIIFDSSAHVNRFCQEQVAVCRKAVVATKAHQIDRTNTTFSSALLSSRLVLVALEDLLKIHGESFDIVESIEWEHRHSAAGDFQPYGPCATGWGQVHQGLKKIYGMLWARQAMGCEFTWVLDSESFPIRRFWFSDIFESYIENPWVQVQDYGSMLGCYGTPALILQECAHLIITHKLRLSPAGAYSYRPSDFWIYENWRVGEFVEDLKTKWGEPFIDIWMRAPAHGEGAILPSWLHLRHARGVQPAATFETRVVGRMTVLDIPTIVRSHMPSLYEAACMNATIGSETLCSNDFSIVLLAMRALGLPDTLDDLQLLLADSASFATREFLSLLRLLDGLPLFGVQGHGDVLRLKALPALLPYWHRGISWCVSNCDWHRHATALLHAQGLHVAHNEVTQAVPAYEAAIQLVHSDAGSSVPHQIPTSSRSSVPTREINIDGGNIQLSCEQSLIDPSAKQSTGVGEVASAWQSWDTCLDVIQS